MSSVIKSQAARKDHRATHSTVFHFDDVMKKADAYLAEVRQSAEKIVAHAKAQANSVRDQARQQGQAEALQQAEKTAQSRAGEQIKTALLAIDRAAQQLQHSQEQWLRDWERRTLELALAMAAKLVRRELRHAPEITVHWVREALDLAADADRIKVHLHPADYTALGEHVRQLGARLGKLARADVVSDPKVSRGGCLVHTALGRIDQQLESQLARIEEELLDQ